MAAPLAACAGHPRHHDGHHCETGDGDDDEASADHSPHRVLQSLVRRGVPSATSAETSRRARRDAGPRPCSACSSAVDFTPGHRSPHPFDAILGVLLPPPSRQTTERNQADEGNNDSDPSVCEHCDQDSGNDEDRSKPHPERHIAIIVLRGHVGLPGFEVSWASVGCRRRGASRLTERRLRR
jgi:hypothetical protein